jgi:homoserine O-acetyltransferase
MERNDQQHTYHEIESDYGHDAFLVEIEKFEQLLREALA